jgi:hypothetical protein
MSDNCTENETTAAIGASVPTTNEAPVTALELVDEELDDIAPLEHPAINNEPAASITIEGRMILPGILDGISDTSLSAHVRGLHGIIAGIQNTAANIAITE